MLPDQPARQASECPTCTSRGLSVTFSSFLPLFGLSSEHFFSSLAPPPTTSPAQVRKLRCHLSHRQDIFFDVHFALTSGAILSWSIVVYKSLGIPSLSRAYLQRAAMDENVQYLAVAFYWFFSKPIYGSVPSHILVSMKHSVSDEPYENLPFNEHSFALTICHLQHLSQLSPALNFLCT